MPSRPVRTVIVTDRDLIFHGLVGLIALGQSNQEIAARLYLSINSVKTYVRTAYRKMGVATRSQAVGWALQRGFPTRSAEDDQHRANA